jgi:hypothetical protein
MRIDKKSMVEVLHAEHAFSDMFVAYLLARNIRYEEDLVDQLFNSSEKRLARILLLLAQFGKEGVPEIVIPKMSQETLAEMVGTTRSPRPRAYGTKGPLAPPEAGSTLPTGIKRFLLTRLAGQMARGRPPWAVLFLALPRGLR